MRGLIGKNISVLVFCAHYNEFGTNRCSANPSETWSNRWERESLFWFLLANIVFHFMTNISIISPKCWPNISTFVILAMCHMDGYTHARTHTHTLISYYITFLNSVSEARIANSMTSNQWKISRACMRSITNEMFARNQWSARNVMSIKIVYCCIFLPPSPLPHITSSSSSYSPFSCIFAVDCSTVIFIIHTHTHVFVIVFAHTHFAVYVFKQTVIIFYHFKAHTNGW